MNKKLKSVLREYIKKRLTGNLGKIVEDEEKIICYIKKSKCKKERHSYIIPCHALRKKDEKLAKAYEINKPIYYVLDGLEFNHKVYLFGYNNTNIIVKNCKFNYGLIPSINGNCIIETTDIKSFYSIDIGATNLTLKNMNIQNSYSSSVPCLYITIGVDNTLTISNSIIGGKKTEVYIESDKFNINNSKISGNKVKLKNATTNSCNNCFISSNKKVDIETNSINQVNVASPIITYNGNDISNKNSTTIIKSVEDSLEEKRIELVELLKNIKNKCEQINGDKINKHKSSLNSQTIRKILKIKFK